jgi:hypothetical protein
MALQLRATVLANQAMASPTPATQVPNQGMALPPQATALSIGDVGRLGDRRGEVQSGELGEFAGVVERTGDCEFAGPGAGELAGPGVCELEGEEELAGVFEFAGVGMSGGAASCGVASGWSSEVASPVARQPSMPSGNHDTLWYP